MVYKISEKINIGHSEIHANAEGFIEVQATDHTYSLNDIKEIHAAVRKLTQGKKTLLLLIASRYTLIDTDARDFLSTPEAESNFIANAYVIKSLAHRLILNFVIQVKGTPVPTKFFTDKTAAVHWLKSFSH